MPPVFTEQKPWLEKYTSKISRTGYFFAAVLLHLIVGLIVATTVIFPAFNPPPDFSPKAFIIPIKPVPPPLDPVTPVTPSPGTPAPDASKLVTIKVNNADQTIGPKLPDLTSTSILPPGVGPKMTEPIVAPKTSISPERRKRIKAFEEAHRDPRNFAEALDDPSNVKLMKFPVYLAAYADGDWACNVSFDAKGEILAGSLPNLVAKINEWSHGNIPGEVVPQPLNIASSDLLDKRPPFIFFTGHKDFTLTPQEVKNLADYLDVGGCIWGDNALPGRGSRFDVAFRREMKRVVPDVNLDFVPYKPDDKIFTHSKFPIAQLPSGMNYYAEQIEHLDIGGKMAIIYTPNDYSDMFSMRILPGDKTIVGGAPVRKSGSPLFTNGLFLYNSHLFFRNFDLPPCLQSDRLGMNIVVHLLTRFDDIMLLTP